MLFRKFGDLVHSVEPHFDSRAINEISFRRDRVESCTVHEFEERYEKVSVSLIGGETEGAVQSEAEAELIRAVDSDLRELLTSLREGEVLLVENQQGVDYPKLKDRKERVIMEGENRFYFHWRVDPQLRIGLHKRRHA